MARFHTFNPLALGSARISPPQPFPSFSDWTAIFLHKLTSSRIFFGIRLASHNADGSEHSPFFLSTICPYVQNSFLDHLMLRDLIGAPFSTTPFFSPSTEFLCRCRTSPFFSLSVLYVSSGTDFSAFFSPSLLDRNPPKFLPWPPFLSA